MKYHFLLVSLLLLSAGQAPAQTRSTGRAAQTAQAAKGNEFTVSGTVSDNDEPLIGVAVSILDKPGMGTVTDMDGKFTIKAERGDKLVFSYTGFKKREYVVMGNQADLKMKLVADNKLDEVVVTALGSQRKISTLSAVTTVDPQDLQRPTTSVANLMGGRVAGVITSLRSGEPGKNISDFWIRGIGTFGANASALVLIDGLEGNINDLDPADIESFSVLKDASATAVYGVRGANGVVLITTKHGMADKIQITARGSVTLNQMRRLPNYLGAYDYAQLANEARAERGETPLYSDMALRIIKNRLDPDLYPDVDWQKETVRKTSWNKNFYVSARGGANVAQYFISLGANLEDAAYRTDKGSPYASNVGYNRYTYRTNLDLKLTPLTKVYFGTDGALTINNNPGISNTDYIWAAQAYLNPLLLPTVYSNGQYPAAGANALTSPYVSINRRGRRTDQAFEGKVTLAIDQDLKFITPGLRLRMQGAYDIHTYYHESRLIQPALYQAVGRNADGSLNTVLRVADQAASFSKSTSQYRKYHFESTLNYDRVFNHDHRVSGLLYYYMSDAKDSRDANSNMSSIPFRYQGISSRLTYGYKDTYMVDLNFGYTGSENFAKGHRFGFFPSVAVGWIPTNYEFVKKALPFLNFLKLRASYGTVGNDKITKKRFPYLTIVERLNNIPFGSSQVETLQESYIGADNLKWEVAKKFDFGIESRLFDERLSLVLDFFHDERSNIFQQRSLIPYYVGLTSNPFSNVGRMVSYGADGNFTFKQRINNNMDFTLRGNFTYSRNDVKNWEENVPAYPYQNVSGYPYGIQRGLQALGLFKDQKDIETSPRQTFGTYAPGDVKYRDVNGDGLINSDDYVPLAYNSGTPLLMYGFGGEYRYKNFTVGILFKGRGRTTVNLAGYGYVPFFEGQYGNVLKTVANPHNRWISKEYAAAHGIDMSLAENPNAIFPRLTYGKSENNTRPSDFWNRNAWFLRLQEVTLNYTMRTKYLRRIGISGIDFQLIGSNLLVWDSIKEFDPEQASYRGLAYPIPATYTLQLYLHF